ncbi:hypothetical protein DID88_001858 [Monilinia fructigena]|uniref:Uncharacterized protein n=1 Tax=Monilinia fructigena TaxID=38457 RepID=A0A395IVU7_9HELO|nr:hypothetical protein DID88_001858 [Monilinia fructigena]
MSPHTSSSTSTPSSGPASSNLGLESMLRDLMTSTTFTTPTPSLPSGPGLDSPASHSTDCESLSNTDTENTSAISSDSEDADVDVREETNWTFEVTPRSLEDYPSSPVQKSHED